MRKIACFNLQTLGYRVIEAANADAAISILAKHKDIDLVFTDIIMPGEMNGFDLAIWLSNNKPNIPYILTSATTITKAPKLPENIQTAIPILKKPYTKALLAESVRKALEQKNNMTL